MSDVYSIAQEYWNEKKNFFQTMQCIICILIWEKIKCIQIANGFKITMKIDMLVI